MRSDILTAVKVWKVFIYVVTSCNHTCSYQHIGVSVTILFPEDGSNRLIWHAAKYQYGYMALQPSK
jgi:hypothetical protein